MTDGNDRWPRGRSHDGGIDEIPLPVATGRLWLCGHRVVGPDPEAALARVDAHSLLCLCQDHELAERYPGYVAWLGRNGPDRARWFPIPDLGVPPLDGLLGLIDDTTDRLHRGDRLIVHCAAGIGRSGTVAAALLLAMGLDHDEALTTVATNRPTAGPEVGSQADLIAELADHFADTQATADPPPGGSRAGDTTAG